MSGSNPNAGPFDVFLCHNSADKPEVREIASKLRSRGLKPWLDERDISPGELWQEALEEQIKTNKTAAIFVGDNGIGQWQKEEIQVFLDQAKKRPCAIIPIILPSAITTPEFPLFLQNRQQVDLRNTVSDPYGRLKEVITREVSVDQVAGETVLLTPVDHTDKLDQAYKEGRRLYPALAKPPDQEQRTQLRVLLDRVQAYWVEGVLKQSLHHEEAIALGKEVKEKAVEPPWKYAAPLPDALREMLLHDRNITTLFDATGLLLILGEPGSGKTTTLLELAEQLIVRANNNPKERVPIVLNLSSWAQTQSLEDWIVAELSGKYRLGEAIGSAWLAQDYLMPLLDGLDELPKTVQPACVAAINTFIENRQPSGLVVCSRLAEYEWLPERLTLNGAVCIEPLSLEDVNQFLDARGTQLAGLQQAMSSDRVLQELSQTPLMLDIMTVACTGLSKEALITNEVDSLKTRQQHIFHRYVEQMFERKESNSRPFEKDQTISWLSWLARKMKEQSQSMFMVEEIQPAWLNSMNQRMMYEGLLALNVGLLFSFLLSSYSSASTLYDMMLLHGVPDLLGVLLFMLTSITSYFYWAVIVGVSIFFGCRWVSPAKNGVMSGIFGGLFFALEIVMTMVRSKGSGEGGIGALELGILGGVSGGILLGLLGGVGIGLLREIHLVENIARQFWKKMISGWKIGLIAGALFGSLVFLSQYLAQTGEDISKGLFLILVFGLGCALIFAVLFGLIGGFLGKVIDRDKVVNSSPNEGIHLSLKNGLRIYGYMGGVVGAGVMIGLFFGREPIDVASWSLFGLWLSGVFGLKRGGSAVIKHYALRLTLWLTGATPSLSRFIPFLDHCAKLILLKKVGGGYIFIHRSLLEYFAELPSQTSRTSSREK